MRKGILHSDWEHGPIGLFRKSKKVMHILSEMKQNWPSIVRNGAFVFDVDMTLLPKGARRLTHYQSLAYLIMRLLRASVQVAIISGNSEQEQMARIFEAIKGEMKDDLSAFRWLTFYVNGGATKLHFDINGDLKRNEEYNITHSMCLDVLKDVINRSLVGLSKNKFGLVEFGDQEFEVVRLFHESSQSKYPGLVLKQCWDISNWSPEWVVPEDIDRRTRAGDSITIPWVEMRGSTENRVASVTIKPTPTFVINDNHTIDVREVLQAEIRKNLGSDSKYNIRSGGSTSTDITHSDCDKVSALVDYIRSEKREAQWVYYFGDEFYEQGTQIGNDEVLARDTRLNGVRKLAVNASIFVGSKADVWLGRSPQAVLEVLEDILIHTTETYE
eukprot:NODE_3361_length_1365_cov_43.142512_g2925_i0.p1 GENE.NODE_3361_length_1365_cov_43.142512_g2925_i0~~NODE_3361_length_1365_cov_43.142512_g2925_i0.p1  ORF type:complete len:450 (-),score=90.13 NODE_3361_length_1365_cov_43.142512_g2925_i0:14-1171(-)